jgi:predicted porin
VQRSDVVNLSASHSFSETWGGALSYNMSRTSAPIAGSGGAFNVGESRQRSFAMSLSRQLADDLSLSLAYQLTQANNVGPSNSAQSSNVSVSLRYAFPTFDASR